MRCGDDDPPALLVRVPSDFLFCSSSRLLLFSSSAYWPVHLCPRRRRSSSRVCLVLTRPFLRFFSHSLSAYLGGSIALRCCVLLLYARALPPSLPCLASAQPFAQFRSSISLPLQYQHQPAWGLGRALESFSCLFGACSRATFRILVGCLSCAGWACAGACVR
jgi:hypothetical protein